MDKRPREIYLPNTKSFNKDSFNIRHSAKANRMILIYKYNPKC